MPVRHVNLTDELDSFVTTGVTTGRFEDASDVVRAGLRSLVREESLYEAKLSALRAAIAEGDASGWVEGDPFEDVLQEIGLSSKAG
jgi:antitoxin ParD1/3/4